MTNISIKDYKIHNLEKEYEKLSCYLHRLSQHINKLHDNMCLNIVTKNLSLGKINDVVKKLNTTYNNNILEICNLNDEDMENTENNKLNLDSDTSISSDTKLYTVSNLLPINNGVIDKKLYDQIYDLANRVKLMNYESANTNNLLNDNLFIDPYIDIKKDILEICTNVGFYSLHDSLSLLIGDQYKKYFSEDENKLINIYNNVYIPFGYNNDINLSFHDNNIYFKKLNSEKDGLINNSYSLFIKKSNNKFIEIQGYFIQDSLNILVRTSQKCNHMIYQKKKNIEEILKETKGHINEKFKKTYIKNSSIKDILTLNEIEFVKLLESDYNKFIQLIKCSFMNLMKEFIKDNIDNMFNIIKLLLLGSDENINVAGLLYGLTKDKKISGDTVANIIYKNLSYMSQIKLRKTNITIKNELERIKSLTIEDIDLKKQIVALKNMPDNVKSIALEKVEEMKSSNNEYYKQQLFVKTLCKFPWPSENDDKLFEDLRENDKKSQEFLDNIEKKLEETVFGHSQAKKSLKELVGKWISNPKSSGSAIGLVGPPGVGKTLFAKGISKALDIPFAQIALGGQNDGEILYGHGYTYSGSQPGMVVKKMIEAGSARCVLYFDELDKTAAKHGQTNEIMSILIHMTDPNMNTEFQDRFFQGINFPLNKVLMCFSYNDSSLIDRILLDRLKKIPVEAYTTDEKVIIVKDFVIKEISENISYEVGSVIIENKENSDCFDKNNNQKLINTNCPNYKKDLLKLENDLNKKKEKLNKSVAKQKTKLENDVTTAENKVNEYNHTCNKCITSNDLDKYKNIEFIIENYTLEAGVRELKRCIEKIFLRLNIDKIYKKGLFKDITTFSKDNPIVIDRKTIIEYLDKPHLDLEKIHENSIIGVINGLYATSVGRGGIVPIQIFKNEAGFDDKFILKLTGSQKNVMKESVMCSLTAATHQLNDNIRNQLLTKFPHGFHIHTPDGATPKDGPSAGCAFTTAFASRILGKPIKNDIAMTGEIDLTGKVTKIGGLLYKLNGAKKAGVTHVFCSVENKKDYEKIIEKNKDLVCDNFKVSFVTNVKEIFKQVIIGITDEDLNME